MASNFDGHGKHVSPPVIFFFSKSIYGQSLIKLFGCVITQRKKTKA